MVQTKVQRVLNALTSGEELTAKQIASRFGSGNPYEIIHKIRLRGYPVYCVSRTDTKRRTKNFYTMGSATREMVSVYYQVVDGRRFTVQPESTQAA